MKSSQAASTDKERMHDTIHSQLRVFFLARQDHVDTEILVIRCKSARFLDRCGRPWTHRHCEEHNISEQFGPAITDGLRDHHCRQK
jgi:hypothetical protein